jgi:hypothetical protein
MIAKVDQGQSPHTSLQFFITGEYPELHLRHKTTIVIYIFTDLQQYPLVIKITIALGIKYTAIRDKNALAALVVTL